MSQADPQASLARLKQALTQLQQLVMDLETNATEIPTTALDTLSTDTENLIRELQREESEAETIAPVVEVPVDTPGIEVPTTPVPKVKPRRVEPVPRRPRRQPWWKQQKVWLGVATAAIAFVFLWKFTTQTPQLSEEVAQSPGSEATEEVTPVTPEPETPAPKVAPKVTEPTPTPVPSTEPPKPLTPEQRLIAAIEAQLDEVTQPYGDNIVRTIQADFESDTLRITVGDAWYLLREGLQDRLGMEVLELAQLLDFKKMVVEDLAGNFVARNPVVGDRLVIMRRYQDFSDES